MTLIIAGSPRKGRYSDRIAEEVQKEAGGEIIYARDLDVKPCTACSWCKGKGEGHCVQQDDMAVVLDKIRQAGTIVLVSPIYWWQVTGTMKLVIDRLYALNGSDWEGKKLAVIMNGEAEADDREYALLRDQFKEMADYVNMEYSFLGVGTPEGDEESFMKVLGKVRDFALNLR